MADADGTMIMSRMAGPDIVEAARGLAPRIRALREESERRRRLPPELVTAVRALRLFHMHVPVEPGGLEFSAGEADPRG